MNYDHLKVSRDIARRHIKEQGVTKAAENALTYFAGTIGTDADLDEMTNAAVYAEEVLAAIVGPHGPNAVAVIAIPNTDADAYDAMYLFEDDPKDYLLDNNYDPYHDPYESHRSIAAEYEGVLPTNAEHLINFAGQTGLPITFIPDITP